MLLDNKQIALNELIVAYREAADHFTDAVGHLDDVALKRLFQSIGRDHNQSAEVLSEMVRNTGVLPRAQYADREEVHQIVTHVKAAFSDDGRQVFLRDRMTHEHRIEGLIAEALKLDFAGDERTTLENLLSTEADILSRLTAALDGCIS